MRRERSRTVSRRPLFLPNTDRKGSITAHTHTHTHTHTHSQPTHTHTRSFLCLMSHMEEEKDTDVMFERVPHKSTSSLLAGINLLGTNIHCVTVVARDFHTNVHMISKPSYLPCCVCVCPAAAAEDRLESVCVCVMIITFLSKSGVLHRFL